MEGVLLVVMPFAGLDRPQLGVSLLKAQLRSRGIPASVAYLNFPFAEACGYSSYHGMSNWETYNGDTLAGERMFARALFRGRVPDDEAYTAYLDRRYPTSPEILQDLRTASSLVEPYLEHCLRTVEWQRYSIIGFTSTSEQNLACLALAERVKQRFPDKTIMMGGGNCADIMGIQLHRSLPFLDYVFTGEADQSFPQLVHRLCTGDPRRDDIPGHVRREGSASVSVEAASVEDMDGLAYPDFDDYFATYRTSRLRQHVAPLLQMETARGCWWGAKHHCTFCGLNAKGMAFRAKSPERALDELMYLVGRYGVFQMAPTDNIISLDYFRTVLPELKRRNTGVRLFYETKANLTEDQVQLMAEAGVTTVNPGIESLSTHVLKLMRKGTSPLQNVQLLKWCLQHGVTPFWNLLHGFPGETPADYGEVLNIGSMLSHLMPPSFIRVNLERFSPYFDHARDFGIRSVRPHESYRYLYPFDEDVVHNIAYFFDFDFDGKEKIPEWSAELEALVKRWGEVHARSALQVVQRTDDEMVVYDTRPNAVENVYRFRAAEMDVIDTCSRAQSLRNIMEHLRRDRNGSTPDESWVAGFLGYLVKRRLVLQHEGRYLSLIVSYSIAN